MAVRALRDVLVSGLTGPLVFLCPSATAQEIHEPEDADIIQAAKSRPHAVLGSGHGTLLEAVAIDTRTAQLNHSLGAGAFGTISTAAEGQAHASFAQIARLVMAWHLAGGQSGFDGLLQIDFGHGARWPAEGHGLMVRGGADLKLQGNHQYYLSGFSAPNVDAGYQYMGLGKLFELSFRTSLLWDGRFRTDANPTTNLPTAVGWGAHIEAGVAPFWTSLQFLHAGGLSQMNADLCSQVKIPCSLCVRLAHANMGRPSSASPPHLTTGTLGIGIPML